MAFAKKIYLPALERETELSPHTEDSENAVEDGCQRVDFYPALVPSSVEKTSLLKTMIP